MTTRKRPILANMNTAAIYLLGVQAGCVENTGGKWSTHFTSSYETGGLWAAFMAEALINGFMFIGEPKKTVWRQPTENDVVIAKGAVDALKDSKFPKKINVAKVHLTRMETSLEWALEAAGEDLSEPDSNNLEAAGKVPSKADSSDS